MSDASLNVSQPLGPSIAACPSIIFLVPYRDREQQYLFFRKQMAEVMSDYNPGEYTIWYINQCDARPFNRGALKNIGLLIAQQKYPRDWSTITFVFNDIDTMPFSKGHLVYETTPGRTKHFYGFTFALGGIVSMTGADFFAVDGFPNYWAWGYEDNALQARITNTRGRIQIDRSQFYPILDKNIMHFHDGLLRSVNREEFDRYKNDSVRNDGIRNIANLRFSEEVRAEDKNGIFMNVTGFTATTPPPSTKDESYDLTSKKPPFNPNDPDAKTNQNQHAANQMVTSATTNIRGRFQMFIGHSR
jgi:hypothetical protein